jgi:D-3-phosphoglycerate dehydrogenase
VDTNNHISGLLFERRVPNALGSEIQGKTILIIGLGATGLDVAKRAKSFGMHVIAVTKNPFLKKPGGIDKAYYVDNLGGSEILSESLSRADYVSLHSTYRRNKEYDRNKRVGFDEKISISSKCCPSSYSG